jgi:hypothetical protein
MTRSLSFRALRRAACGSALCLAVPHAAHALDADAAPAAESAEAAAPEDGATGPALIGGRPEVNVFATILAATAGSAYAGLSSDLGQATIETASLPVGAEADVPVLVNPEPSTVVLLAGGAAVLAGVARRRARRHGAA